MSMHEYRKLKDGRKRVSKLAPVGVERVKFPPMELETCLGLWVRTTLWYDMDAHFEKVGGESCGWTRDFASQHVNPRVCGRFVEQRFPGFVEQGNLMIKQAKGRELRRSETIQFKSYRYTWSGFHNRKEQKAEFRFGPGIGLRHWNHHSGMSNLMLTIRNLFQVLGPGLYFEYDINKPELVPTPKVK